MININLLSPEQKQEIKTKRIYTTIRNAAVLTLLFTTGIGIILITSRLILENRVADMVAQKTNDSQSSEQLNSQIAAANKKIDDIALIQKNFKRWSVFFNGLSQLTPDNITFRFIKIYYSEATIQIQGTAKTRQDLLKLKNNIESSPYFSSVDLPLSNILAKENNDFDIKAKINLNKIP